jgi:maleylacetate reductase
LFASATMHTPIVISEQATTFCRQIGADCIVALGGGSTTGLSKAIALRTDLPQLIIPTTYAGSEMTPILGETANGIKTTQKSPRILPEVVIYDVNLTLRLPVGISGTSGINAIAHAVEALYAQDRNPIVSLMAMESIGALHHALPLLSTSPQDQDARADALYGAFLAGSCLGAVGMALHHKLCHTIGGLFDLSHAQTHNIIATCARRQCCCCA